MEQSVALSMDNEQEGDILGTCRFLVFLEEFILCVLQSGELVHPFIVPVIASLSEADKRFILLEVGY